MTVNDKLSYKGDAIIGVCNIKGNSGEVLITTTIKKNYIIFFSCWIMLYTDIKRFRPRTVRVLTGGRIRLSNVNRYNKPKLCNKTVRSNFIVGLITDTALGITSLPRVTQVVSLNCRWSPHTDLQEITGITLTESSVRMNNIFCCLFVLFCFSYDCCHTWPSFF